MLPPWILVDSLLRDWLIEDIGRGDRTTGNLLAKESKIGKAHWVLKEDGVVAGLPIAARAFWLLNSEVSFVPAVAEGESGTSGEVIARLEGPLDALLTGERVALNIVMRLSGIASVTRSYVNEIEALSTQSSARPSEAELNSDEATVESNSGGCFNQAQLVDTRKTTPGFRVLEKYATAVGGAVNHRLGLDDAVMIKDNHIQAAGGIAEAITKIRKAMPYPLNIEVETTTIAEVEAALSHGADIIMLDNMPVEQMEQAVKLIRQRDTKVKIEASGNVTLKTIRAIAQTGVDYISSSAPITRSTWLDISMRLSR